MKPNEVASPEYRAFLDSIKERVRIAQVQAVVAVNHELVLLNQHRVLSGGELY